MNEQPTELRVGGNTFRVGDRISRPNVLGKVKHGRVVGIDNTHMRGNRIWTQLVVVEDGREWKDLWEPTECKLEQ